MRCCLGVLSSEPPLEHSSSLLLSADAQVIVALHIVLVGVVYGLVWTRLVDLHDVLLSLFHEHPPNVPHVSQLRALLDLVGDLRVLRKDLLLQAA